jgi:outer membrane lipoprotein-sorting protein
MLLFQKTLTVLFFLVFASVAQAADELIDYLKSINTVVADFRQIDDYGEIRSGLIYVKKPKQIRIDYLTPSLEQIFINSDTVVHFNKALDEVTYINLDDFPLLLVFNNPEELRKRKDVKISKVGNEFLIKIENKSVNCELLFNASPIYLKSIATSESEANSIIMQLSNYQVNEELSDELFILQRY